MIIMARLTPLHCSKHIGKCLEGMSWYLHWFYYSAPKFAEVHAHTRYYSEGCCWWLAVTDGVSPEVCGIKSAILRMSIFYGFACRKRTAGD